MRVGIVSPYSLSLPGGVQGQVLGLARALRTSGHDVRVLGPCDGPPPDVGVTPLGGSVPTSANGSVAPIAPDVSTQLRTISALRDEAFDVVHLHEPLCPGPTQTALLFKTAPLVGTFHAAGNELPYRWFGPVVRRAARRLDVRCAVSDEARDTAFAALGGDYELVPNAVDVGAFVGAEPWPTDGHPTIVFVGRHEERKGLAVLLEAVSLISDDLRLWVVGSGPQTETLKARHRDPRIVWLGRVDDAELASRLVGADVFCAPSLGGESFGIVLLEAMASGTPVVASDIAGYAKVARGGQDALLVPPGDASALSEALRVALADTDARHRLVTSGTGRAAQFSMERLAETYLGLYERAINAQAARAPRSG